MSSIRIHWSSPDVLSAPQQHAVCDAIVTALGGTPAGSSRSMTLADGTGDGDTWTITIHPMSPEDWKYSTPEPAVRASVARWMREELEADEEESYGPPYDINITMLAENAADEADLCLDDANATIPEWVFELSAEVAGGEE